MIHPFHRKSFYLVNPYRSVRPSTRLDIGRPDILIAFELCTLTMAQPAATSMMGITTSPVNPGTPTTTPMVAEVNIGNIMEQAKRLSVAVNEVGENNMRHMGAVSLAVDVVGSEYYDHLHEMTTTSLQRIQASLRVIHQQMTAYTSTMGPNATEFHRVKADVAAAIELADLYLSPTPIPQLIFHPTDTQQGDVTPSNDTLDAPTMKLPTTLRGCRSTTNQ